MIETKELLTDFCNQFNEKCQPPIPESPEIDAALAFLNKKLETLLLMQECGIVPENCHPSWKQYFRRKNKVCSSGNPSWKQYFQSDKP